VTLCEPNGGGWVITQYTDTVCGAGATQAASGASDICASGDGSGASTLIHCNSATSAASLSLLAFITAAVVASLRLF